MPDSDPVLPWGDDGGALDPCALDAPRAALLPALRDAVFAAVAACSTKAHFYRELPSKDKPVPPDLKVPQPKLVQIRPFGLTDAETVRSDIALYVSGSHLVRAATA